MSCSPESHLSMIYFFCAHLLARFWSGALLSPLSLVWQNSKREQNDAEMALCVYASNGMFVLGAHEHLPAAMIHEHIDSSVEKGSEKTLQGQADHVGADTFTR